MTKYAIEFYKTEAGKSPAKEFVLALDTKMKAKILRVFDMLEKNGPEVRMPHTEMLEDGIFEIRAKQGSDITRLLYFFRVGRKIIVTNGFVKKTQRTPLREIETAKRYRADYERRYGNE